MFRILVALCCGVFLSACGATRLNQTSALAPGDETALIVMSTMKSTRDLANLRITTFDAETGNTAGSFGGQHVSFSNGFYLQSRTEAGKSITYAVTSVRPGSFVYRAWTSQTAWAVCFHADTLSFDVGPGEVVFLGNFDGSVHSRELQVNALLNGDFSVTTNRGNPIEFHHYFDDISPPDVTPPTAESLDAATRWLNSTMPNVTAPVRSAEYAPATFAVGRTLTGLDRICGGYYASRQDDADD